MRVLAQLLMTVSAGLLAAAHAAIWPPEPDPVETASPGPDETALH
jgi:hypothetical protein